MAGDPPAADGLHCRTIVGGWAPNAAVDVTVPSAWPSRFPA